VQLDEDVGGDGLGRLAECDRAGLVGVQRATQLKQHLRAIAVQLDELFGGGGGRRLWHSRQKGHGGIVGGEGTLGIALLQERVAQSALLFCHQAQRYVQTAVSIPNDVMVGFSSNNGEYMCLSVRGGEIERRLVVSEGGLLGATQTTSATSSNETDLATSRGIAADGRRLTNVLMVTTTVRMVNGLFIFFSF